MLANGWSQDDPALEFAVTEVYEAACKGALSMRERQERDRADGAPWIAAPARPAPPELTPEELAYLVERLAGVNDPVGAGALAKLEAMRK